MSLSAKFFQRYIKLLRSPDVDTFNESIITTITNYIRHTHPKHPHLSLAILAYLTQQYHVQNKNHEQVMMHVNQLILQHTQTASSLPVDLSQEEVAIYTTTIKLKATNILEQMFLSDFPNQQKAVPTELSQSQQELWRFLNFMGNGEWDTATSILACWDPADFTPLMNAGMKVYIATINNPADSDKERLRQFSRLKATVGQRAKDVSTRTRAELLLFQSKINDPGSILFNFKQSTQSWNNGYYDKEILNTWFSLMREPYISSDKLSPESIRDAWSQTQHLGYIAYRSLVERHTTLHALHHQVLCTDAYRHTISQQQFQVDDEDEQENGPVSETKNHLVLILPFGGHVWEIDSYDTTGPLDLGLCAESWTAVAATRLLMWHSTTAFSGISVDIQAITNSS
ncbi:hypothetical protein EDD21DRAFT_448256 [Dissophora ornata]|nr:hypothetical protein EDD21DRAFT_448256 [Dissophora ornata]